jgi:ribokinase
MRSFESLRFVVAGSFLADCHIVTERIPDWGEDLRAEAIRTALGGKALNQAVVLAWHGARVSALGAVGDDPTGRTRRPGHHRTDREDRLDRCLLAQGRRELTAVTP